MHLRGSRRRLSGEGRSGRERRSARWHRRRSFGPVRTELIERVRWVQTWEASGAVAHGVAVSALLFGDRLGTQLNEMTQDVGAGLFSGTVGLVEVGNEPLG